MEFEFDKEIDALLQQAARGETASEDSRFQIPDSKLPHPDADEISAFAENALPEKTNLRLTRHFADCDRCRRILSDSIRFNSGSETVPPGQIEKVAAPKISRFQKLFAFPNVAYTLGALIVVFSGLAAFILLQSVDKSQDTEVSQMSEQPLKGEPFSEDSVIPGEKNVNVVSNNSMSNASSTSNNSTLNDSMANVSSTSNSASVAPSNAKMSNASTSSETRNFNSNSSVMSNKSTVAANDLPKQEPRVETETAQKAVSELPLNGRAAANLPEQKSDKKEAAKVTESDAPAKDATAGDAAKSPAPQPKAESAAFENRLMSNASGASKKMTKTIKPETTIVSGKTFNRAAGVWIDSAYQNQAAINVSRGTDAYKKLDSGLRSIAENLSGAIVVVFSGKAYRIQ